MTLNCLYNTLSSQTNSMRYNCKALYTLDEVVAQCKAAILKADHDSALDRIADRLYDEVLSNARWENDLLIAA